MLRKRLIASKVDSYKKDSLTVVVFECKIDDDKLIEFIPEKLIFDIQHEPTDLGELMKARNLSEEDVFNILRSYYDGFDSGDFGDIL